MDFLNEEFEQLESDGKPVNVGITALSWHEDDHSAVRVTFIVAMVIASITGLLGNILIIGTIGLIPDLRTTGNAFLANLAFSGLILIIVVVPFNIVSVVHGAAYWTERVSLCIFVASICAPGCLAAIWSNTGVALNRYFFICHNRSYDYLFSPAKTFMWIVCIWLVAFGIHLPNHVGWGKNTFVEKFYLCTRETNLWTYSTFFAIVGIILPLTLSFYSYCRIYILVRTTTSARNQITKSRRSNGMETDENTGQTILVATSTIPRWKEEVQLVQTLFRSFAVFLVSWLPLAILLMLPMLEIPTWIYLMTVFLAHGSTASNSVLYYLTNAKFRQGFGVILGKLVTRKKLHDRELRYLRSCEKNVQVTLTSMNFPGENASESMLDGSNVVIVVSPAD